MNSFYQLGKLGLLFSLIIQTGVVFADDSVNGAQIWRANCASCHGADGRGAPQIKQQLQGNIVDFSSLAFAETVDRKSMLLSVRDGVADTIMPAFRDKLSYAEIIAVTDYLRENFTLKIALGEDYELGKGVFADNCSVCHGDQGQGAMWTATGLDPKPANFTDPVKIAELDRTRMLFSVTNGRPETAMVSWKNRLSSEEITAVVNYIRAAIMKVRDKETEYGDSMGETMDKSDPFLSGETFDESLVAEVAPTREETVNDKPKAVDPFLDSSAYDVEEDPNLVEESDIYAGEAHDHAAHMGKKLNINDPLPNDLSGEYFAGKTLYENTCIHCHGENGDGKGPRAYFIFPKPRNFTHPAARESFSRAHIFEQVRTGVERTEMPAWGKVLTEQQMADVAEYVFSTFIRPQAEQNESPVQVKTSK
ncbi:cytochrome c [Thalassotalea aquiviva]|uniref:cytochrome c n=1 Tax=Thalassotalea aquiviva TaxID=3242415 RepID=UPI00352AC3C1